MNVYQPLRRSLIAFGLIAAAIAGAEATAAIGPAQDAEPTATLAAVSVSPTCVTASDGARKVCYQANVVVGAPEEIDPPR